MTITIPWVPQLTTHMDPGETMITGLVHLSHLLTYQVPQGDVMTAALVLLSRQIEHFTVPRMTCALMVKARSMADQQVTTDILAGKFGDQVHA